MIQFLFFWIDGCKIVVLAALCKKKQIPTTQDVLSAKEWRHPAKCELNCIRILGCDLIGRSQEAHLLRRTPHSTSWEEIEKSGSARLCGLMSRMILPSFSSIGYEERAVNRFEDPKRRAPECKSRKSGYERSCGPMYSIILQSFSSIG